MKLAKIGIWSMFFSVLSCLLMLDLKPKDVGPGWPSYLLKLDESLSAFANDKGERNVIAGPSYASRIEIKGYHNLGLPSASPSEIVGIIKTYCDPQDTIFFVLTPREFTFSKSARLPVTHDSLRKLELVRAEVQNRLVHPRESRSSQYELAGADLRTLKAASDLDRLPCLSQKYLYREICLYSGASPSEETIRMFRSLQKKFPNILFVMHPTFPLKRVSGTSLVAQQINQLIESRSEARRLMAESGLPFVDLSDFLAPEYFQNYSHLTTEGSRLVAEKIRAIKTNHLRQFAS